MRYLLVSLLLLSGCAAKAFDLTPGNPGPVEILPGRAISVFSYDGLASACAVEGYVMTARHVTHPWSGTALHEEGISYAWSAGTLAGTFNPYWASPYRDLGMFMPASGDMPAMGLRSKVPLQAGDTVRWIEYSGDVKDWFAPVERSATVQRTIAGHVTFDREPEAGASGTCLYNDQARVVGIVTWGVARTGIAVLLTGEWWRGP